MPRSDYSANPSSGADAARKAVQSGLLIPPVVSGGGGVTQIFVEGSWASTFTAGGFVFKRTITAPAAGAMLYLWDGTFFVTSPGYTEWRLEARVSGGATVRGGNSQKIAIDGTPFHFASWMVVQIGDLTPGDSYEVGIYCDELDGGGTATLVSGGGTDSLFSVLPG